MLVLLLSSSWLSAEGITDAKLHELAKSRYWQVLLHVKNGRSEIDDPSFFLTPPGHFSAETELKATIYQIREHNQTIACRYPARIYWLKKKLPELFIKEKYLCQNLEERIDKEHIRAVTLVFPTAYMNSPASMFGHTFLRLDKNPDTPLISEAVNYAAQTDETNGLVYTYRGLTGGYKGFYSVLPYYKKIKEYSAMEQRDMWEYTLNLSNEEIRRLLYHLYELQGVYGDYYFFTKNCSYNLLWLLESAKEDTFLPEQFGYKVIPVDTIRLLHEKNLITKTFFRPSKKREMQLLVSRIEDRSLAKKFVKSYKLKLLENLNQQQKAKMVGVAVMLLKQRRSQKKINKKDYVKTLMKLLRYRSKLPEKEKLTVRKPSDPLLGHRSARIAVWVSDHQKYTFVVKPAMHDLYDISQGYLRGAYIDFFKLSAERSRFQRFDFVSVTSLPAWDYFFRPVSWSVKISLTRVHHKDLYLGLEGGVGVSFARAPFRLYALLTPQIYQGRKSVSAAGLQSGLLYERSKMRTGFLFHESFFDDGVKESRGEWFLTQKITDRWAFNIKLYEDKIDKKSGHHLDAGFFYYF